jgi:hypothetical protein
VMDPLLAVFDFYAVAPEILDSIIEGYVEGEIR